MSCSAAPRPPSLAAWRACYSKAKIGLAGAPRVSQYFYDWRDRLVASKDGVQASESDGTHRPILYTMYDNLDEAVVQQQYDGDGVTISSSNGVPQPPNANLLRARSTAAYDDQGRVYQ